MTDKPNQFEILAKKCYQAGMTMDEVTDQIHRAFLVTVFNLNGWNQCRSAEVLGVHRNTIARYVKELNIQIQPHARKNGFRG